ncbi:MAG TPA: bifunctional riboflavin kinase/FMN adenylyltransferase [Candidatus Sulfotelmatobacter sp.]|nr:bifunctional riboflavin kinase/FMN adenylyltransferase [Candidatus Sulfotelmatobacter sp.]
MEIVTDLRARRDRRPLAVIIGAFDSLHRGHQRLLRALVEAARSRTAQATVVTFTPHPDVVLRGAPPLLLCDPRERDARFAALGVDLLVRYPFDRVVAATPAEAFVAGLMDDGPLAALLMTHESAFGQGRGGTLASLPPIAAGLGFDLLEVPSVTTGGGRISDSRLRELVTAGWLARARLLLGRRFAVIGTVVHGDGRGRGLGYPTANLAFDEPVALPPDGIYAVHASWGGRDPLEPVHRADGVASLGVRPTFGERTRLLEAHLFDVSPDLYGQRLRVEFVRCQRGERRFGSVAALVEQMDLDAARARRILASAGPTRTRVLDSAGHS